MRDADRLRCQRAGRGIVRHQAQENLRAHADANSPQTHKEKILGGEVAHAETKRNAGEIAVAEKKDDRESDSVGDAISEWVCIEEEKILVESHPGIVSESVCFSEEEKVFTEPDTGILSECVEQEEETKDVANSESITGRIARGFGNSERDP